MWDEANKVYGSSGCGDAQHGRRDDMLADFLLVSIFRRWMGLAYPMAILYKFAVDCCQAVIIGEMEIDNLKSENIIGDPDFRFGPELLRHALPPVSKFLVELIDCVDYFFNGLSGGFHGIEALVDFAFNLGEHAPRSKQGTKLAPRVGDRRGSVGGFFARKLNIHIVVVLIRGPTVA